jgi:hypothetical protein
MPIPIFDYDTMPRDRRAELEAAVIAAGRHLKNCSMAGSSPCRTARNSPYESRHTPELDISVPFD